MGTIIRRSVVIISKSRVTQVSKKCNDGKMKVLSFSICFVQHCDCVVLFVLKRTKIVIHLVSLHIMITCRTTIIHFVP